MTKLLEKKQGVPFNVELEISKHELADKKFFVEGYVSTTDYDLQGHVVSAEAIRASKDDLLENSTVLFNHDPNHPIGKVVNTKFNSKGLWVRIEISASEIEIREKIKEGVLNKFSIRGRVLEAHDDIDPESRTQVKIIDQMYLTECSLVSVPANTKAAVVRWYETEKSLLGGIVKGLHDSEKEGGSDTMTMEPEDVDVQKGLPTPDAFEEEWEEHMEAKGLNTETNPDEIAKEFAEFLKQRGYPSPGEYPYPKPKNSCEERMGKIAGLVSGLLKEEKDDDKKKVLSQILDLTGAKKAEPEEEEEEEEEKGVAKGDEDAAPSEGDGDQATESETPSEEEKPAEQPAETEQPAEGEAKADEGEVEKKVDAKTDELEKRLENIEGKLDEAQPRKGIVNKDQGKDGLEDFRKAPPLNRAVAGIAKIFGHESTGRK